MGSFLLQILWTTLLGWALLFPRQPWAKKYGWAQALRSKDVTAAHVDWVILGLVNVGAALVIPRIAHRLDDPHAIARCLVYSSWVAPLTYFFRGFGINGFRITGLNKESVVGLTGFTATSSFTYAWIKVVQAWFGW